MASSIFTFGSHIPSLIIRFGILEPVVHLMHSALMVMFQVLIMAPSVAVSGRGRTQPYNAQYATFLVFRQEGYRKL